MSSRQRLARTVRRGPPRRAMEVEFSSPRTTRSWRSRQPPIHFPMAPLPSDYARRSRIFTPLTPLTRRSPAVSPPPPPPPPSPSVRSSIIPSFGFSPNRVTTVRWPRGWRQHAMPFCPPRLAPGVSGARRWVPHPLRARRRCPLREERAEARLRARARARCRGRADREPRSGRLRPR
jgi:hypothetical protein